MTNAAVPTCPQCGHRHPLLLEGLSQTVLNYFRCGDCWHVWTEPKDAAVLAAKLNRGKAAVRHLAAPASGLTYRRSR